MAFFFHSWQKYDAESPGRLKTHFARSSGLGVATIENATQDSPISGLWGVTYEVLAEDLFILIEARSALAGLRLRTHSSQGVQTARDHLLLGPLNLVNHACAQHATISYVGLNEGGQLDEARFKIQGDTGPLVYCYEDCFSSDSHIQCELCPANCFFPPDHVFRDWRRGIQLAATNTKRELLSCMLAEDWVMFSLLQPLANGAPVSTDHPLLVTHSIGNMRQQLAMSAASLLDFSEVFPTLKRNQDAVAVLDRIFHTRLSFLEHLVNWTYFWSHVRRWMAHLVFDGNNKTGYGNLLPTWDEGMGLGIAVLNVPPHDDERIVTGLWGCHEALPTEFDNIFSHIDNRTSLSKKIVYSKPNNYGLKNYCVALSGPPLDLNDYSLAPPTRRLQNRNRTASTNG